MHATEPSSQTSRWTRTLLLFALPCDPMRDAILGDLHEEFVRDVTHVGVRRARMRYMRRTADVVAHALADSIILRRWVSTTPPVGSQPATMSTYAGAGHVDGHHVSVLARVRDIGGDAGFAVLALFVLAVGIVVNTMLFSAIESQGPGRSSAAGIGGVILLLACVVVAAVVMCAGPRWRRKRSRGT